MTKLIVIPALLKAHIDSYTRKDGTFVQAHDDKRQAAQPMSHDDWVSKVKAVHGNVDFKKNAKTGVVSAWSGTSHVGRYKFAQGGEPASHHIAEKQSSDSAQPAVPPHVQKMVSDVAQSSAKPEHKQAAIDAIMSQHAAPGGATNRQAALSAYSEKRKLAGQHGQAALDAAEKARNSKDPAHAAEAISAVEKGLNAHKEAAKAARAIPYPGNSSPWEHHDERASALSKMSEEMRQLHQNLSKAAKPRVVMRKDAAPAGSMTPDAVKDHAMKAGAKFKSGVAVFSKPESAHSFARQAAGSKGGAFVMKHPDHSHHVVVNGADAQRMEKNGYQHV